MGRGKWRSGEVGKWGSGVVGCREMGRPLRARCGGGEWGDGEAISSPYHPKTL
ncbi:MAG: hypothetical protein O9350_09340 [Microcystis sp. LE19-388.1G]|nr:hypothetical protein [Microcystis sp. LE19-388.1G]